MKSCSYCGRQNPDSADKCFGCGSILNALETSQGKTRGMLCSPGGWVCLAAAIIILQGLVRVAFTPDDPRLGEGDYKRVTAAFYFWLSLAIGLVVFGYGFYLLRKAANPHQD